MSQNTAVEPGSPSSGGSSSSRFPALVEAPCTPLVSPAMAEGGPGARIVKRAAGGTAAGAVSGLFGVGGGIVIVPLLVLWLGYGERLAGGNSLAAHVVIAGTAPAAHGPCRK